MGFFMRTKNSFKNIGISIFSQLILILLGFLSRKVFLDNLGSEYLGVNGLLTNILGAMVLIEGGIGGSIVYNLYKPLAEDDKDKIVALVQLYKKAYFILALIMGVLSLTVYQFLDKLIKDSSSIKYLGFVYFLFVAKSIISYLYAYKGALINADQKGYVLARNNLLFQVISIISKIFILVVTKNYVLYLLIEVILFLVQNIVNSMIVNKRYPYIKVKKKNKIDLYTKKNIVKNVKAMFIQNIGNYIIFSTDNILISSMINIATVGLYSNYTMIMGQLSSLLQPIISGIGNSVGNLIATESKEKSYFIFEITFLISFWIYSFASIFLYNLLEPFINWWLGEGYLLSKFTFIVLIFNFYLTGMRNAIGTFKAKAGLFAHDKYVPLIEGIINLVLSIVFIKYLGLPGVFLGTICSYLIFSFWNQPRIVYKEYFKKSVWKYFSKYILFTILGLGVGIVVNLICNNFISGYSFISLILRGLICVSIINVVYLLMFFGTKEFKYLLDIFKPKLNNIKIIQKRFRSDQKFTND